MKVRNILIGLLVVLMAFVFISCNDEPEQGGQTPVQVDDTIYKFTTTKGVSNGVFSQDKFSVRFKNEVEAGETISFEFRSTVDFFQVSVRSIEGGTKYVYEQDIKDDGTNSFTLEPLSDGWTKFSYTFADDAADSADFRVDLRGWLMTGEVMEFRHVFYAGEQLALSAESMGSYGAPTMEIVEDHQWNEADKKVVAIFVGQPDKADKYPVVEAVAKGEKATLSGLVRENYELENVFWYDKSGNKGEVFNKDTDIIEADTFLLAEWKGVDVDITFHKNYLGAEAEALATTTEFGKAITLPATDDWKRDGWKITGWTTEAVATEENAFNPEVAVASTDAIEIYAQWSNVSTLTLNLNFGDTPETKTIDVNLGEAPVAAQVGRPGYVLSKWTLGATDVEGTADDYDYSAALNEDKTIYAQWTKVTDYYRVQFPAEGDTYKRFDVLLTKLQIAPKVGDVLTFKYRSTDNKVETACLRNSAGASATKLIYWSDLRPKYEKYDEADGWNTFYFVFTEKNYKNDADIAYDGDGCLNGIKLELAGDDNEANFANGDYIDILGFSLNGGTPIVLSTETFGSAVSTGNATVTPKSTLTD